MTVEFSKILVANRSEIAERIIRTCAQMGIATAVVFTEHDADASFVRAADEAVPLGSGVSYLDIDAIVDAALLLRVDAVHPGYGFLAESAEFARAVEDAGIGFIGPAPAVIATMGSKIVSRESMMDAGVPVLTIRELGEGVDPHEAASAVGYPLVVKASSGGGGRGMRIVAVADDLVDAIAGASREASSAFGDGTVYLERYVDHGRHIEVQIFGDAHGNVVHLYERECSVQRRFQKVVEEAPAPGLDHSVRSQLWEAAVAAGRAVGYVGAGTVEFIVASDGSFAFLEMNTRLQVEHPVTEMTTGLDLVRMQIQIAQGEPLPEQDDLPGPVGHAIEARLYAEIPRDGFSPATGTLHRFAVGDGVRVDTGVQSGDEVGHHYDPMLAKVIAHAPTRREAARRLALTLTRSAIHGVETNRDLLAAILTDHDFLSGTIDTGYLEREIERLIAVAERSPSAVRLDACVAALALQADNRATAPVLASIPSGWRNVRSQPQSVTLIHDDEPIEVRYTIQGGVSVGIDGDEQRISSVFRLEPELVDVVVDGVRIAFEIHHVAGEVYVDSVRGSSRFLRAARFPIAAERISRGAMVARTPGNVVAVLVSVGDTVAAGETIMVIEAMKMEQSVIAPFSGLVSAVHHGVGDQVEAGTILAEIDGEESADG